MDKVIATMITDLGLVFRHILPGVFVLIALHERYPHGFFSLDKIDQTSYLVILGVIGLAAGNVAMSLNRYFFMQLVDWSGWWWNIKGKGYPGGTLAQSYPAFVASEVSRFYGEDPDQLRSYVRFREAAGLFLLVAGEAALIPILEWPSSLCVLLRPSIRKVVGIGAIVGAICHLRFTRSVTRRLLP